MRRTIARPRPRPWRPIARLVAHLVELLENAVELLGRNADAGILDLDAQPVLNPAADDPDVSGLGIAHRILDQVPEHASEQRHIAAHPSVQDSTCQPSPLAEAIGA